MFNNKQKIAILGFGKEGRSTFDFLTHRKQIEPNTITIIDENENVDVPSGTHTSLGKEYLHNLSNYDIIIRSAGVSPLHPKLQKYIQSGGTLTSHMAIFFQEYHGKLIAITGTKGKSTTTQIIYNCLQRAQYDVTLLGNMGKPALSAMNRRQPSEYAVCELSSYMLEDTQPTCEIAIITNMYHEHHQQWHGGIDKYFQAKRNITTNAKHVLLGSDISITPPTLQHDIFGFDGNYKAQDEKIFLYNKAIMSTDDIKILGYHNYYNACAALAVCDILGIDYHIFIQEVQEFNGLEHRMEYVGQYNDIHRYNDSIASTPDSTIAALRALKNVQTLFLGGIDGGYAYDELIAVLKHTGVRNIVLYPETGRALLPRLEKEYRCHFTEDFEEGILRANEVTNPNQIALLSCAGAYTLGIPFEQKGARFKKVVQNLTK